MIFDFLQKLTVKTVEKKIESEGYGLRIENGKVIAIISPERVKENTAPEE